MAAFYSTQADGSDVRYRSQADVDGTNPVPANATFVKVFDEATNAALVAQYQGNTQAYSFSGNTLVRSGVPVEFNPDGAYFAAKLRAPALLTKIKSTNDPITRQEIADVAAIAFRAAGLPST